MADKIPLLAGIHHLKLPVSDLARSLAWYRSRLGYEQVMEVHEGEKVAGIIMNHPRGGPALGLWLDPERAKAAAGFDYFAFAVPHRTDLEDLAERLTALGEIHPGVHPGAVGSVLPHVKDPDAHELRFQSDD